MDTSKQPSPTERRIISWKKPSLFSFIVLLLVGASVVFRAYRDNRRFEAQTKAFEKAVEAADRKVDAALRQADQFADDELRKRGLSEEQIREINRRSIAPVAHTNK